jgi:signal peptidase I
MLPEAGPCRTAQPLRIPAEPTRRPRQRGGVRRVWASTLLAAVVAVVVAATVGVVAGAWRFVVIDTGSMRHTLNPGDVAVLEPEPLAAVERGQIIAFHPPGEPRLTVTHRVFSLARSDGGVVIRTKGDANNAVDAWRARLTGRTVWHETLKVPKLGYLAVWSQQRSVRFSVLLVLVILAVSIMLGWVWRGEPLSRERPVLAP